MKDLYIPIDNAPNERVSDSLAFDYEIDTPPMKERDKSLAVKIKEDVFNHLYENSPQIFNLPNNIHDFVIPRPKYS